jgi:Rap1a immunity proteins
MRWLPLVSLLVAPVRADFIDGNDLLAHCMASEASLTYAQDQAACLFYVMGATDAQSQTVCIPQVATTRQAKDVVVRYLERNPQKRHLPAASLVTMALIDAFPCR